MKHFKNEITEPENITPGSYWFIFNEDNLLVNELKKGELTIPQYKNIKGIQVIETEKGYMGKFYENPSYYSILNEPKDLPENLKFHHLRLLIGILEDEMFELAGNAYHLAHWDQTSKYCGRCGSITIKLDQEKAKQCVSCGLITYPKISPAVIVTVLKEDKILLATNVRFKNKMYSVLAGFVEPGESLEECIYREIKEEVNIEVKNIRYFGSQPWPFPDSLMIAFIADYKSGEIIVDNNEITDANWFTKDNLPELPRKISIARKMIDWFLQNNKS